MPVPQNLLSKNFRPVIFHVAAPVRLPRLPDALDVEGQGAARPAPAARVAAQPAPVAQQAADPNGDHDCGVAVECANRFLHCVRGQLPLREVEFAQAVIETRVMAQSEFESRRWSQRALGFFAASILDNHEQELRRNNDAAVFAQLSGQIRDVVDRIAGLGLGTDAAIAAFDIHFVALRQEYGGAVRDLHDRHFATLLHRLAQDELGIQRERADHAEMQLAQEVAARLTAEERVADLSQTVQALTETMDELQQQARPAVAVPVVQAAPAPQ